MNEWRAFQRDERAWKTRQMRRLWGSAVALVLAGFLFALGVGALGLQDDVRISDTHGQTGLLYSIGSDPTVPPGIAGPVWQLLVRTDSPAIYYKSGTANTAWTRIGFGPLPPSGQVADYGNGQDGAGVADALDPLACATGPDGSGNYALTRDCYYSTLTVDPGVSIHTQGFRVFVRRLLTCNGTIDANGINGSNGTASLNWSTGSMPIPTHGGAAGPPGAAGAPGGNTPLNALPFELVGALGGSGGTGSGVFPANAGGAAVGTWAPEFGSISAFPRAVIPLPWTGNSTIGTFGNISIGTGGGGGNGGGSFGAGGQGGTGGGWLVVSAFQWVGTCELDAKGGNGGNAQLGSAGAFPGGGGGGGGGGGVITFITTNATMPPHSVAGGLGGAAGNCVSGCTAGSPGGPGYVIDLSNH